MAFVHLQVHSEFSILQASARLDDIFAAAAADNAPAVALTDHAAMFGILEFQERGKSLNKKRKEKGLEPIKTVLGCHVYIETPSADRKDPTTYNRLTLLVENKDGYYNLLRIVSHRYEDGDRWAEIPSVPLSVVKEHKEGVIAIAGDYFSHYGQNVAAGRTKNARPFMDELNEIFDHDHLYLSVCDNGIPQQSLVNEYNIQLAKEYNRELVAVADVHYIHEEDNVAHKALRCIAIKTQIEKFEDKRFPTTKFYFKTEEEMRALFGHIPGAIENTVKIAERCNFEVVTGIGDDFWPVFEIPKDFLEGDECKEISALMQAEYEAEYPGFYEKAKAEYCKKNEKDPENLDDDDRKAIEKATAKSCKPGSNADRYIIHLCNEFLNWRFPDEHFKYPTHETDVGKRMYRELNCIRNMNVAGYLLIVWDFINWSRNNGIPVGPGRGSAAGSLVTYIIGITDIDPLKFDLLFERFLNPERVSMPDIDTDISDRDRSRVIDYVTDKYGKECVGQIITYGMLKAKNVIKDVARVLGIDHREADGIIAKFPQKVLNFSLNDAWTGKDKKGKRVGEEENYQPEPLQDLINSREAYKNLWSVARMLEDLPRQTGVHACGVVITPTPIYNLAPLYRAAPEDTPVVMYDKHYSETIGLLKMDFLGLINLSIIQDTVNMVERGYGFRLEMNKIPIDDKKTYELLSKGMTVAVFQFESPGMQKYLRDLHPDRIGDLIAMNALYRPGPIGEIPRFIRCKAHPEEIDCYCEDLEPVLSETYGVIVYQEQVMKLAQILGGYTLGGADNIRRIMAKKMPEKMAKLEPEFFEKCIAKGYDKAMIQRVWDAVLPFCGYAFNKSHAAAYAYVAYQTAYLKAHYGPEYMAASLTADISKTDRIVVLLQECGNLGIKTLPPCVNRSMARFDVDKEHNILYALGGIRNVGVEVSEDIVRERMENGPYKSIFDLCKRVSDYQSRQKDRRPPLNKKVLESLIQAGALDNLPMGGNRASLFATVDKALNVASKHREDSDKGQVSLFDLVAPEERVSDSAEKLEEAESWTHMELLNKEKAVIGLYLSSHPLEEFRPELIGFTSCSLAEDELNGFENAVVQVAGVVTSSRSVETKKGATIGFVTIQDFAGEITVFFNAEKWEEFRNRVANDDRVLATGKLVRQREPRPGQIFEIVADSITSLDDVRNKRVKYVHISVTAAYLTDPHLDMLLNKCREIEPFPGEHSCELVLHVETEMGFEHALVARGTPITYTSELLEWLSKEFLVSKVWVSEKPKG